MVVAAVFTPLDSLIPLGPGLGGLDSGIFTTFETTFSDPGCFSFSSGGAWRTDVGVDEGFVGFFEGDTGAVEPVVADFAVYHPGSIVGFVADAVELFGGAGGAFVGGCRGFGGCYTRLSS